MDAEQNALDDTFIRPGFDLQKGAGELSEVVGLSKQQLVERWTRPRGREILNQWKAAGFRREVLDSLVGKYYGHTDIRGIPLAGENLEKADLSRVDLYGSDLENAGFRGVNLTDAWISESNIKGSCFDWATLDDTLLDNVEFDKNTSFIGVNLNAVNFTLAALLQELAIAQQRIANLERTRPKLAWFLKASCDYGRSFQRFFFWAALVILVFGLAYFCFPSVISRQGFLDSIYFSFVTFTTLGFGDIEPTSWIGKVLVIAEVVIGYVMLGLLVAIISRRVIGT